MYSIDFFGRPNGLFASEELAGQALVREGARYDPVQNRYYLSFGSVVMILYIVPTPSWAMPVLRLAYSSP